MEMTTTDNKIRLKQMQISFENEPQQKQQLQNQLQKLQLEKEIEQIRKKIEHLG